MQALVERMIDDFEHGILTRRQLALSLSALAAAGALAPAAQAAAQSSGVKAVTLNHVTVRVPDLQKTSQFYQQFFGMPLKQHSPTIHILGVGKSFFGIEQKPGKADLDHYDFGIAAFDADDVMAKLKARSLAIEPGATKESFKFHDPDGFLVQVNGPDYTGHVGN